MSEYLQFFQLNGQVTAVVLPFEVERVIQDWYSLRKVMIKDVPAEFTRDEWAYLISFLDTENLYEPIKRTFGDMATFTSNSIGFLLKPRGNIALWLPGNVSLLGPLMMIRMKASSQGENLTSVFLNFALRNLHDGMLKTFLESSVILESFDRTDPRNQEMAATADIRIVFGSNQTAIAIDSMTHPIGSVGIYFIDKQSEAWVEKEALDDQAIESLIKIFAIYGQAGCTSPRKVVIIGGNKIDTVELKDKIVRVWPRIITRIPSQYIASSNIMACQWASALGWEAELTEMNGAVIAAGSNKMQIFTSLMSLPIVWANLEEAANSLPGNIQTIGHTFKNPEITSVLTTLAGTKTKRFVPVSLMHHFGHVWDGYAFWRQLFEEVEVRL